MGGIGAKDMAHAGPGLIHVMLEPEGEGIAQETIAHTMGGVGYVGDGVDTIPSIPCWSRPRMHVNADKEPPYTTWWGFVDAPGLRSRVWNNS